MRSRDQDPLPLCVALGIFLLLDKSWLPILVGAAFIGYCQQFLLNIPDSFYWIFPQPVGRERIPAFPFPPGENQPIPIPQALPNPTDFPIPQALPLGFVCPSQNIPLNFKPRIHPGLRFPNNLCQTSSGRSGFLPAPQGIPLQPHFPHFPVSLDDSAPSFPFFPLFPKPLHAFPGSPGW